MSFFNNLFQGDDKKNGKGSGGGGPKNPFAGLGGPRTFQGSGQSLGGNTPGQLIHVELKDPGTLGMKVSALVVIEAASVFGCFACRLTLLLYHPL
jgi:hypothetical protein